MQPDIELPEWRRELARRLQRIKDRREPAIPIEQSFSHAPLPHKAGGALRAETAAVAAQPVVRTRSAPRESLRDKGVPSEAAEESRPEIAEATAPAQEETPQPAPLPEPVPSVRAAGETTGPGTVIERAATEHVRSEPAVEAAPEEPDPPVPQPAVEIARPEPAPIQLQIDDVWARRTSPAIEVSGIEETPPPALPVTPAADRLILLSRTLSGLVDLTVVFVCGFGCVMAAEVFSGFLVVDAWTWANFVFLQTAIFFLYSVFFLGTANQTIGMMVTDIQVVDPVQRRPRLSQILVRSAVYLASLLGFGIGLAWGFFDPESACLHDKISKTSVIRISSPEDQAGA